MSLESKKLTKDRKNWLKCFRHLKRMENGRLPQRILNFRKTTLSPTKSLSRNAGLLVSYTSYLTPPQITSVASLKLQTHLSSNHNTTPVSISVNPPHSTLDPVALKVSLQSPVFYCWGRPLWFGRNIHFRFVSFLYVLATLTRRLNINVKKFKQTFNDDKTQYGASNVWTVSFRF